jgi:hypothetical protein
VVGLGELEGLLARADFLGDAVQLIIKDVAEALGENKREDVVLVFRRVLGPADGARSIPDPGFEGFILVRIFFCRNGHDLSHGNQLAFENKFIFILLYKRNLSFFIQNFPEKT